jgi:hypothetical protein
MDQAISMMGMPGVAMLIDFNPVSGLVQQQVHQQPAIS